MKQKDKDVLVAYIAERAQDEEILRFVDDIIDREKHEASTLSGITKYIGLGKFVGIAPKPSESTPVASKDEDVGEPLSLSPSVNYTPVCVPAKRIGEETKQSIMGYLRNGPATLDKINSAINGKLKNTESLLALLCVRKLIKFDGDKYLVK